MRSDNVPEWAGMLVWPRPLVPASGDPVSFCYDLNGEVFLPKAAVESFFADGSRGKWASGKKGLVDPAACYRHPEHRNAVVFRAVPESIRCAAKNPGRATVEARDMVRLRVRELAEAALRATEGARHEAAYAAQIEAAVAAVRGIGSTPARSAAVLRMLTGVDGFPDALSRALSAAPAEARSAALASCAPPPAAPDEGLQTDPDWAPGWLERSACMAQLSPRDLQAVIDAVVPCLPRNLGSEEYKRRKRETPANDCMSRLPREWATDYVPGRVNSSSENTRGNSLRSLLETWKVMRPDVLAGRGMILGALSGATDSAGRSLVRILGIDADPVPQRPDELQVLRGGWLPLVCRQQLDYVWTVGRAPRPDHIRALFTSAGPRKGKAVRDWSSNKDVNFMNAMRHKYVSDAALSEELGNLSVFYFKLFGKFGNRPKILPNPKQLDDVSTTVRPVDYMMIVHVMHWLFRAFLVMDGSVDVRRRGAEATRLFCVAGGIGGVCSQSRPGDSDNLAAAGRPCHVPNCPDPSRCMGNRFVRRDRTVRDSSGREFTARVHLLLQPHFKNGNRSDTVHFVNVGGDYWGDALVHWEDACRARYLEEMRVSEDPGTFFLEQQGGAFCYKGSQALKDIVSTAARVLGLPLECDGSSLRGNRSAEMLTDGDVAEAMSSAEVRECVTPLDVQRFRHALLGEDGGRWREILRWTCSGDLRKVFINVRDDDRGLKRWYHEALRWEQHDAGEEVVGLAESLSDRSEVFDHCVTRGAKTSMLKRTRNYTVNLGVHDYNSKVYGLIRRYFVAEGRGFVKGKRRGMHAAPRDNKRMRGEGDDDGDGGDGGGDGGGEGGGGEGEGS